MNMKGHILAALAEQFDQWEELLKSLNYEQITTPRFDQNWSIKDVIAHLWGWQQISIARVDAAAFNKEPEFPRWTSELNEGWEENANRTNAWFYETQHTKSWLEITRNWREGFLKILDLTEPIPEKDLLDGSRYSWLKGYSLVFILVASYDHNQEHLEKLIVELKQ